MANPRIEIDALLNDADFLRNANKIQVSMDRLDTLSKKTGLSSSALTQAMSQGAKQASMSWTDFRSMYSTVLDVVRVGQAVWEEVGQKYVDNAVKVGDMARALGTTTEEASRLKEVADDVGISISSLTVAIRTAQKDGFEPTIEGLAQMSEEYLRLAPGVERTQFLMDRFGKSGLEMGKLLDKGSQAIRDNAAAIEESLIVTQEAYEQARQYEIAVDSLKDSWDALTYQAAPPLVSALTNITNHYRDINTSLKENGYWYTVLHQFGLDDIAVKREQQDATLALSQSSEDAAGAFETEAEASKRLADEAKDTEQAIKDLQNANKSIIDGAISATDATNKYNDAQEDIRRKVAELIKEKEAYYPWETKKIDEAKEKIDELSEKYDENAEEFRAAMEKKFALMAIEKIAMQDGIAGFSESEYEKARLLLETTDIATAAAFEETQAQAILTDAVATGRVGVAEYGAIMDSVMADGVVSVQEVTDAINAVPIEKTITFNIVTNGAPPNLDPSASTAPKGTHRTPHAGGGSFMVPASYGNEGFRLGDRDTASGRELIKITPQGETDNSDKIISAIYSIKIDEDKLARLIVEGTLKGQR